MIGGPRVGFDPDRPDEGETAMAAESLWSLIGGPPMIAEVVHLGDGAVQIDHDGRLLALVPEHGFRSPVTIALGTSAWPRWRDALAQSGAASVGGGRVRCGELLATVSGYWPTRPVIPPLDAGVLSRADTAISDALEGWRPEPYLGEELVAARCRRLARAIAEGPPAEVRRWARSVVGLGPGATPSGDDVIAGAVAALHHVPLAMTDLAPGQHPHATLDALVEVIEGGDLDRTTRLSASLLLAAARGDMLDRCVAVLENLGNSELGGAVGDMLEVGHRSGGDMLRGLAGALRALIAAAGEAASDG